MLSSWEIEYSQLRSGTDEIRYFGVRLTYWQGRSQDFSKGGSQRLLNAALPRVSAGPVVLSRHEGPYKLKTRVVDENILYKKTNFKKVCFSTMAFTAKILSWRFRYLNIVGCLLRRRPTGSRAPQDPPPPQLRP